MNQRHLCLLGCCAYQEIDGRNATVISADGEQVLQLACSLPQLGAHHHSLERI
jgi:hypothetical protein